MHIICNQVDYDLPDSLTVQDLVAFLAISTHGTAIAVNDGVVPRSLWAKHGLAENDRVLVIRAAQGG